MVTGDTLDEEGLKPESEISELGGLATCVHLGVAEQDRWENAVFRAVSGWHR